MELAAGVLGRDLGGVGTVWAARPEEGEARDFRASPRRRVPASGGRSSAAVLVPPRVPWPRGVREDAGPGLGQERGTQESRPRARGQTLEFHFLCFSFGESVEKENNRISASPAP